MNNTKKWSALKLAVLLGAVSALLTGCFIWRDNDHDREESHHHDQDHHEDQEHHEYQEHHE